MARLALIAIFVLALLLRVYSLSTIPNGFHIDEAANGYIGRYILLNGHDLANRPWPIDYSDKFEDYPPVIPMYLSALPTFVMGVNEFAVRLPSAIFGAILVVLVYQLVVVLTKSKRASLVAALLTAVLPWSIVLSRTTSETSFGLVFFALGLILVFKNKIGWSIPIFLLSYLVYPTFRTVIPMVFFGLLFVTARPSRKMIVTGLVITLLATILASQTVWGQARFKKISLLTDPNTVTRLEKKSQALGFEEGPNNVFIARFYHNKITTTAEEFTKNYLDYLSPRFLFFQGGLPDRVVVPERGVLLIFTAFVIILGLLISSKNKKLIYFFTYLLLISIIPAALTIDEIPSINRAAPMIIPIVVLVGLAADEILALKFKKPIWIALSLGASAFLAIELLFFLHYYFIHAASYRSFSRNDGAKEMAEYLISEKNSGKKILATASDWEPIYYLFYSNNFSKNLTPFGKKLYIKNVDNITFVPTLCVTGSESKETISKFDIILEGGGCDEKAVGKTLKVFTRQDESKSYKVIEVNR